MGGKGIKLRERGGGEREQGVPLLFLFHFVPNGNLSTAHGFISFSMVWTGNELDLGYQENSSGVNSSDQCFLLLLRSMRISASSTGLDVGIRLECFGSLSPRATVQYCQYFTSRRSWNLVYISIEYAIKAINYCSFVSLSSPSHKFITDLLNAFRKPFTRYPG